MKPERIPLAPDAALAHALAEAAGEPVIVEANGVRYQMTPKTRSRSTTPRRCGLPCTRARAS